MSIIYVQTQGAEVRRKQRRLVVIKDDETLHDIPCVHVESLHLFGGISLSTPAASLLLQEGVDVAFYTQDGRLKGRLTGPLSGNVPTRALQARLALDPSWPVYHSRGIVCGKIQACLELLIRHERKKGVINGGRVRREFARLATRSAEAGDAATLRGIEGSAARLWFRQFPTFVHDRMPWNGRSRRPPRDPLNALLSLSYSLLSAQIIAAVDGCGLDPYLGALHGVRHGQPSLALDLLEPFRPSVADRFVLRSVNLGVFRSEHFTTTSENGCRLIESHRTRFFEAWEGFLESVSWRRRMFAAIADYRKGLESTNVGLPHMVAQPSVERRPPSVEAGQQPCASC